jgi:hypothetical protein
MRKAFTTLELLAATALTALLMVTVLQVVGSIGRTRAAMAKQGEVGAWRSDVIDAIRHDLSNSTRARFDPDRVTLTGHAALDRGTMAAAHEPVTVTYGFVTVAGRGWLYRRQAPRDGVSDQPAWRELLCPDVTGFTVRPVTPIQGWDVPAGEEDAARPVPPAVVVQIDGPAGRLFDETIMLR